MAGISTLVSKGLMHIMGGGSTDAGKGGQASTPQSTASNPLLNILGTSY